jgi:lysylphosphatidylglycerol synthetase-like protein (DUF2156 family)
MSHSAAIAGRCPHRGGNSHAMSIVDARACTVKDCLSNLVASDHSPANVASGRERAYKVTSVPPAVRIALLRQHGTASQAYSATFQPGLEHFGDERGFLAYKSVGRTAFVLSDPIAPSGNIPGLIARFLHEHPDAAFCCISPPVAQVLAARGFFVNAMGPDTRIDLQTYNFDGGKKRLLREAFNRMAKRGFITRECTLNEVGIDKIKAVSDAWRKRRVLRDREARFLTQPLVLVEEPDVRRFFTFDRDGKLVAFSFFEPVYEAGKVIGYVSQHNRHLPEADTQINFAMKRVAIEVFQKEGLKVLYLGLSPFAQVELDEFGLHTHRMTREYFKWAYGSWLFNRFLYACKGLEMHKRLYRGVQEQTYYAFNRCPSLLRVLKLMRVCNII